MWLVFLLSALLACVAADSEGPECPPEDALEPCFCERHAYVTYVICDGIRNVTELDKVLEYTKGKNLSFEFWNVRFGDIPSNYFEGQLSTHLIFEHSTITSFGDKPFSGLEDTLVEVFIYSSVDKRKNNMKTFPIGHLKKLELLTISENNIDVLENELFRNGPDSIKELVMTENKMVQIGDTAFAPLVNLKELWMAENRLENLTRSMFPKPANKLEVLDFDTNRITSLPTDIFDDMPALKSIGLSENRLETISEDVFGKVWGQLDAVYFEGNRIVCDQKIKWIYQREKLPDAFVGRCNRGKLRGVYLEDLTLEDFE